MSKVVRYTTFARHVSEANMAKIRHVKFSLKDAEAVAQTLVWKFAFKRVKSNVLKSGNIVFVLEEGHSNSARDVSLVVDDIEGVVDRVRKAGGSSLIQDVKDVGDGVLTAVVRPPCVGDVVHTLIQNADVDEEKDESALTADIDHITYVCEAGDSAAILAWYERCFGMRRFRINGADALDDDGFVIGDDVGMRLKAAEWVSEWLCDEIGVCGGFKLVLAEPLAGDAGAKSHVRRFLRDHGGPGLQHIGLTCGALGVCETVRRLVNRGAEFRTPPPTYYQLPKKALEIEAVIEDVAEFKALGLLLDLEADDEDAETRALIQVFTKCLFPDDGDTFFLEVLERRGARGFGAGNITALAQSIQLFLRHEVDNVDR